MASLGHISFLLVGVLSTQGTGEAATREAAEVRRPPVTLELSRNAPISAKSALAMKGGDASRRRTRRRLADDGASFGAVEVLDCENTEYTGMVYLGTPPQEFQVVLDTGSYDLWVTSTGCIEGCENTRKYDSSASSTYVEDGRKFSQLYEDGSEATGILSTDTLHVGGLETTATFGEMMTVSVDGCSTVDGVMGMGVPTVGTKQSVFEDLVQTGVVDIPVFSFYIGNIDTGSPTGVFTLGGVNQTHYEGCLEWIDVVVSPELPSGFWSAGLKDITVESGSVLRSPSNAILDTGTSMIVGPFEDVAYLADEIGATCISFEGPDSSSIQAFGCMDNPKGVELILMECVADFGEVNISFGGDNFALTANELLQPLTDFVTSSSTTSLSSTDPWCLFGMLGHEENMWILGDSFLRTFYSAYDVAEKKVGLAKATAQRTGDECQQDASVSAPAVGSDSGDDGETSAEPEPEPAPTPVPVPADTPAPTVAAAGETPSTSSAASSGSAPTGGDVAAVTPAPVEEDEEASSSPAPTVAATEGVDADEGNTATGSSSSRDGAAAGVGGEVEEEGDEGEREQEERPSVAAVAATSVAGTLAAVAMCGAIGVLVVRRIRRGEYRHTKLVGSGGSLEMGANGLGGGGGAAVMGDEDDFLQAEPGRYKDNSGSHRYRVANNGNGNGAAPNGRGVGRLTVMGPGGEAHDDDDDEEEDDGDEVEVDFGVSRPNDDDAAAAGAAAAGPLGRGYVREERGLV